MLSKAKKEEEPLPEDKKIKRKNSLTDESSLSSSSCSIHSDDTSSSFFAPMKTQYTMTEGTSPEDIVMVEGTMSQFGAMSQSQNLNKMILGNRAPKENKTIANGDVTKESLLTAKIGYGIAATGLTDCLPLDRTGTYEEIAARKYYSDLVGVKHDLEMEAGILNENESRGITSPVILEEWRNICREKQSIYQWLDNVSELNPPIRQSLLHILNGKVDKFQTSFPLPKNSLFGHKSFPQQELVQKILGCLENTTTGMNLILFLSTDFRLANSTISTKISCAENDHSNCTILNHLLANLPPETAKEWIRRTTKLTSRNALHFAVIGGSPCHIDVLSKYMGNIDLNRRDFSGRSPIHYALLRNASVQVRQLMWLGADIYLPAPAIQHPLFDTRLSGKEASSFHSDRSEALNRCMKSWLSYVFDGSMKIIASISNIHLVKLEKVSAVKLEVKLTPKYLTFAQSQSNVHLMMFAIPVQWTSLDQHMSGKYPHIVRQKLTIEGFEDVAANIFPKAPKLHQFFNGMRVSETIHSALPNIDAGVYAWWIPKTLTPENNVITFPMDPSQIEPSQKSNILLFQIFAVTVEASHPTMHKPTKASISTPAKVSNSNSVISQPLPKMKKLPKLKTD